MIFFQNEWTFASYQCWLDECPQWIERRKPWPSLRMRSIFISQCLKKVPSPPMQVSSSRDKKIAADWNTGGGQHMPTSSRDRLAKTSKFSIPPSWIYLLKKASAVKHGPKGPSKVSIFKNNAGSHSRELDKAWITGTPAAWENESHFVASQSSVCLRLVVGGSGTCEIVHRVDFRCQPWCSNRLAPLYWYEWNWIQM